MSEEQRNKELTDTRKSLLSAIYVAQERYKKGKESATKRKQYEDAIIKANLDIDELRTVGNHLRDIYKNIESYSVKHQQRVRDLLDLAIIEAGNLVPDADVAGIHLQTTENNRVSVVNALGQNVNLREGSGYRAILGALLRYASIKAQPDALQFMLFDEYFFTLSDTTTAVIKDTLEAMKKDLTIICIEQRRNVVDGIVDEEFVFKKGLTKVTTVERVM